MQCVQHLKVSKSVWQCTYITLPHDYVHTCAGQQSAFVFTYVQRAEEKHVTTSKHMAHMSRRSSGTLTLWESMWLHLLPLPEDMIALWQQMIPIATSVHGHTSWYVYATLKSIPKPSYICTHRAHCTLHEAVPSFNWKQGSVTCVRKWDYDRVTA